MGKSSITDEALKEFFVNREKIKKALQKIDEFENSGTLPSVIIAWIKEIKEILEK